MVKMLGVNKSDIKDTAIASLTQTIWSRFCFQTILRTSLKVSILSYYMTNEFLTTFSYIFSESVAYTSLILVQVVISVVICQQERQN